MSKVDDLADFLKKTKNVAANEILNVELNPAFFSNLKKQALSDLLGTLSESNDVRAAQKKLLSRCVGCAVRKLWGNFFLTFSL